MRSKYLLPLVLAAAAMSACGDDSSDDEVGDGAVRADAGRDGSVADGGGIDSGQQSGLLQPGTYALSNIVRIQDGCELTLEDGTQPPLPLDNTGATFSLGNRYDSTTSPSFDPPGFALGSGPYATSTTANLTVNARVNVGGGCQFNVVRTTKMTYTGNNMISVDYTNVETNHTAACDIDDCTSHYTFNMSRTDGGI